MRGNPCELCHWRFSPSPDNVDTDPYIFFFSSISCANVWAVRQKYHAETMFMMTAQNLYFVSSTMIKELYLYGGDISAYVPPQVLKRLESKMRKNGGPKSQS